MKLCRFFPDNKLFKGKEESQNGGQPVAGKCLNATATTTTTTTTTTQHQKTETNNKRSSHGLAAATVAATGNNVPGGGGGGNGSTVDDGGGGDLIHLPGPLTEDAVLKALHSRFCATQMFVSAHIK